MVRKDGICVGACFIKDGIGGEGSKVKELEPRSNGGSRLNGDIPGRSKNQWRVLGLFTFQERMMFQAGEFFDS